MELARILLCRLLGALTPPTWLWFALLSRTDRLYHDGLGHNDFATAEKSRELLSAMAKNVKERRRLIYHGLRCVTNDLGYRTFASRARMRYPVLHGKKCSVCVQDM